MAKKVRKTAHNPTENLGEYAVTGGPGRPIGSKNKTSREVLQEILDSLADLNAATDKKGHPLYPGGYLVCMGHEHPKAFMTLLARCLPKDVKVEGAIGTNWEDVVAGWNRGPARRKSPSKPGA